MEGEQLWPESEEARAVWCPAWQRRKGPEKGERREWSAAPTVQKCLQVGQHGGPDQKPGRSDQRVDRRRGLGE